MALETLHIDGTVFSATAVNSGAGATPVPSLV